MRTYSAAAPGSIQLLSGELYKRYTLNCQYMMSLECDKLLLNFYNEAGLIADTLPGHTLPAGIHTGWESPTCQLRGHFLGHYLSACAWGWAYMGNDELKGKGDHIVRELRRCQVEHGDGWVFSIPREYLEWVVRGKRIWAPQYTAHKTLMGLMDMHRFAGSELALTVAKDAADWFFRFSERFTEAQFDEILDVETGGMMEFFADLYSVTGEEKHKKLVERYYRRKLFEPMLGGKDVLTNMHANTTIPEALGCARAYEVTGDVKYLEVARAYWDMAVTNRGYFVTGGQTCYEAWTPPFSFTDRLNEDNQEHCTVYNMIRLADFLFRHTGRMEYQDYIERNFRNGILAQQHPDSGMVAYYLPMQPGARANWGTPTGNFWCCHGTLVQAQMLHAAGTLYLSDQGLTIAQYRPVSAELPVKGSPVRVRIRDDFNFPYALRRPYPEEIQKSLAPFGGQRYLIDVECDEAQQFQLELRIPWWVCGQAQIELDGEAIAGVAAGGVVLLDRKWKKSHLTVYFPSAISAHPLPDDPGRVAFMDGPDVLVGLTDNDALLMPRGRSHPRELIRRDSRLAHVEQKPMYHTRDQLVNVALIRLSQLGDEQYTMYFSLRDEQ
jgi:DUF1680 family protein